MGAPSRIEEPRYRPRRQDRESQKTTLVKIVRSTRSDFLTEQMSDRSHTGFRAFLTKPMQAPRSGEICMPCCKTALTSRHRSMPGNPTRCVVDGRSPIWTKTYRFPRQINSVGIRTRSVTISRLLSSDWSVNAGAFLGTYRRGQ